MGATRARPQAVSRAVKAAFYARSFLEPDQLDVTIVPEFSKNDEDDSFSTRMALFVLSMQT